MNTSYRRVLLALTALLGLYVGVWAEFFPRAFYDSFPGLGMHWIDVDGAWDEHLVRDVGSFYLALSVVTVVALVARSASPGRLVGLAWGVFGVLHFGYHVTHPEGTTADVIGSLVSLVVSALLGVLLALPGRRAVAGEEQVA
jgi:hypothetical protein